MAKVVYTVRFEVTANRAKLTAPAVPGYHFTAECRPEAKRECKDYIEAFLRLLHKAHKALPTEPKNFSVQNVFIEIAAEGRK
jgi:predicted RNase H-like HicB family nuclease